MRKDRRASRLSIRGCSNWAGPSAGMCGSTTAGAPAMPIAFVRSRRNWSRSRRMSSCRPAVRAPQHTVPIVFVTVVDPVGSGFVDSLARPGGNINGFTLFEYSISRKWLELLKEIAPGVTRAAVIRDAALTAGGGQLGAIQAVAPSVGVEVTPVNVRDAGETQHGRIDSGGCYHFATQVANTHWYGLKRKAVRRGKLRPKSSLHSARTPARDKKFLNKNENGRDGCNHQKTGRHDHSPIDHAGIVKIGDSNRQRF
jgi:ABC transporter substrate binding protein